MEVLATVNQLTVQLIIETSVSYYLVFQFGVLAVRSWLNLNQPIVLISTFPRRLKYRTVIQVADLAEEKAFGYTFLLIHNEAWS